MRVGGDMIQVKAKSKPLGVVLYPRGPMFLCKLPGEVVAPLGRSSISTTAPLHEDIRRGDAIRVGSSWFRVSTNTGKMSVKSQAPLSVSSVKDMAASNQYLDVFDDTTLPLDAHYDARSDYRGSAYKHGCSNDIRALWAQTVSDVRGYVERKEEGERALQEELLRLKLISVANADLVRKPVARSIKSTKKPRKKRVTATASLHSQHLIGTELAYLQETH